MKQYMILKHIFTDLKMESFNSILIKVKWTKLKKKHVQKKIKIRKIILIPYILQKEQEQKQNENGIFFLIVKDN